MQTTRAIVGTICTVQEMNAFCRRKVNVVSTDLQIQKIVENHLSIPHYVIITTIIFGMCDSHAYTTVTVIAFIVGQNGNRVTIFNKI